MHVKRTLTVITLAMSLCLAACAKSPVQNSGGKLSVTVTTDALYEMATYIGGDRVTITRLIPDGMELHDYEPRAKDIVALGDADMLIINGLGLEPWIDDAVRAAANSELVVVDASLGIAPIPAAEHGDEHDPHIWLSVKNAMTMAENICHALIASDPGGETDYTKKSADFTAKLDALYREYEPVLTAAENRVLVTGHAVFAYLCRDFGLTQNSVEGVFAEGEPSPQRLAELSDYCRDNGILTVFAESGSNARIIETLAREAGAAVVTIYTIESAEDGMTYLARLEYNLSAIAAAIGG